MLANRRINRRSVLNYDGKNFRGIELIEVWSVHYHYHWIGRVNGSYYAAVIFVVRICWKWFWFYRPLEVTKAGTCQIAATCFCLRSEVESQSVLPRRTKVSILCSNWCSLRLYVLYVIEVVDFLLWLSLVWRLATLTVTLLVYRNYATDKVLTFVGYPWYLITCLCLPILAVYNQLGTNSAYVLQATLVKFLSIAGLPFGANRRWWK